MNYQINQPNETWSLVKKIGMLILMSYMFLYMFPFPFSEIPFVTDVLTYYQKAIANINLFVGKHILKIVTLEQIEMTGSGDTTYDYVMLFTNALLSICIALILSSIFYKKKNYNKWYEYIIIYARYYVGLYLISYGLAKIAPEGQFSFPGSYRLEQKYGDSSPMGLLWTFMGYSKAYAVFGGIGELTGGLLLLFRKTQVVGCLISFVVMINVMMMNFCYDVPVKLFSSHLVLFIIIILIPYLKNIYNFFICHQQTLLQYSKLELPHMWMRISRIALKILFITSIFLLEAVSIFSNSNESDRSTSAAINGDYKTVKFSLDHDTSKVSIADSIAWSKINIRGDYARIFLKNDSSYLYQIKTDTITKKVVFTSDKDSTLSYSLSYKNKTDTTLHLFGEYKNDKIHVELKQKLLKDYSLVKRGFNWINEYPPNW